MLDTKQIRKDFPIYSHIPNLAYLDSASTSLKPKQMLDKLSEYYEQYSANIKRGVYSLSEKATSEYEHTREVVAQFINAKSEEIVFTRNTTESLNLVMYSVGTNIVNKGDEIVTTVMEHHSNFVPWQQLAFNVGADFKVVEITDDGVLVDLTGVITKRTKILAIAYISNVLGTVNPLKEIISAARKINPSIIVVVDAAQAVPHFKVDVKDLDCDFFAFSAHKTLGPTGLGILYGKKEVLDSTSPFLFGGEMIEKVSIQETTFAQLPEKFEAGTPAIAEVIAFGKSIEYLENIGMKNVEDHVRDLVSYSYTALKQEFGKFIHILGPQNRSGVISFNLRTVHPHDIASILNEQQICIRGGHHCAMPLHTRFNISSSARMSFHIYNDKKDVDRAVEGLKRALKVFS